MKILLASINSKYVHTNLALRYIYKVIEEKHEVDLKEYTINMQIENIVMDITEKNYDLICFSTYIWNIDYVLRVSRILKEINSKLKIMLGGPEVTYSSRKVIFENPQIDYIMLGEGEEIYLDVLEQIEENSLFHENITMRKENNIVEGKVAKVRNTENIPRVASMLANEYDGKIIYFESSRGCPFRCSYCLSSLEKTVRPFDMDRVKSELKILLDKNVRIIKFVDRTFNYNKERALELWKYIIENRKDTICHFEIAAHILDRETIDFLKTVPKNSIQFEIGVQTTNKNTIKEIDRNTSFEKIKECIILLKEAKNIHFHLDLIAGLPYEDYNSFKKSFNDVYALQPECLQLGFLKLLSGCKITNEREKHGYKYIPYPPYEVLSTSYISYDELKKLKKVEIVLDIYNNSEAFKSTLEYIINNENNAYDFFYGLSSYFEKNNYFKKSVGLEEAFDILYSYQKEVNPECIDIIKEYLKHDYNIRFNSKRYWFEEDNSENIKKYIDIILKNEILFNNELLKYKELSRADRLKRLKFVEFKYDIINKKNEEKIYIYDKKENKYICMSVLKK